MPVRSLIVAFEYLTDEQARRYVAFVADPSPEELERFFFLNAEALELARTKRRRHIQDVAQALQALGGARVILATATNAAAINAGIGGLSMDGEFVIVGLNPEPMSISAFQLGGGRRI